MKTTKTKIAAIALGAAMSVTTLLGGAMLNTSAITTSAEENDGIMPISHIVETPSVTKENDGQHNCLGVYTITQNDVEADIVYFKSSESAQYNAFSLTYHDNDNANDDERYYVVTASTTSTTCIPSSQVCRAYCTRCEGYSDYCVSLRSYRIAAKYPITNKTYGTTTISTSYTTSCTWSITTGDNSTCCFSVANNGKVVDSKITPTKSYKTVSVVVDGVTFTIRANLTTLSIKASSSVECNSYDTMFAFYVEV